MKITFKILTATLLLFVSILLSNNAHARAGGGDGGEETQPVSTIYVDGETIVTIDEGLDLESLVGTITSDGTDLPIVYSFGCEFPGDDDEHFQINDDRLETATVFDYANPVDDNSDNEYEICILSTDNSTDIYQETITVIVEEVVVTAPSSSSSTRRSSSRRLSRAAVNQLFGTSPITTTTPTPSPSTSSVQQIQTQLISLLTQLIAIMKG